MNLRHSIEIGKKYGMLTVISIGESIKNSNGSSQRVVVCKCDCGNIINKKFNRDLIDAQFTNCGCLNWRKEQKPRLVHGMTKTGIYQRWLGMVNRCHWKTSERSIRTYQNRGIVVCDEWRNDFMAFYKWAMENGYKKELTIDRIENNDNYEPSNCQWITKKENSAKTIRNVFVEVDGISMRMKDACAKLNVDYKKVWWAVHERQFQFSDAVELVKKSKTNRIQYERKL